MIEYTWTSTSDSTEIEVAQQPSRFALTTPTVFRDDVGRVLLVDPNPAGTWETWMLPFASRTYSRESVGTRTGLWNDTGEMGRPTLGGISQILVGLRAADSDEYLRGVTQHLADLGVSRSAPFEPLHENYSLKFSKTANVYTAYAFQYILILEAGPEPEVPFRWIDLGELLSMESNDTLDGRRLAENVLEAAHALAR